MKLKREKCINGAAFQWPRAPQLWRKNKEQRTSSGLWGSFSIAGYIMRGGWGGGEGRGLSGCHNKEFMQVLI
jgi:hypothetical protein